MIDWSKRPVNVPGLSDAFPNVSYEQCVVAGPLVFVAGQTGWFDGGIAADFEGQARQALASVRRVLEAAGARFEDIVSMTVFLTDQRFQPTFGEIRSEVMAGSLATSATIGVAQLFHPSALIEIQAIAVKPPSAE